MITMVTLGSRLPTLLARLHDEHEISAGITDEQAPRGS
jgi:hypothetical protein